jgi:hypothetical protein
MDKEERKQYNKVYYSLHRERILSYLCEKVNCDYCGRCVIRNNLAKHEKSEICKRTRDKIMELNKWRGELGGERRVLPLTPMLTTEEGV